MHAFAHSQPSQVTSEVAFEVPRTSHHSRPLTHLAAFAVPRSDPMSWSWDKRCERFDKEFVLGNEAGWIPRSPFVLVRMKSMWSSTPPDRIFEMETLRKWPRHASQCVGPYDEFKCLMTYRWPLIQMGWTQDAFYWALDAIGCSDNQVEQLIRLRQEGIWGRAECSEIIWKVLKMFLMSDNPMEENQHALRHLDQLIANSRDRFGGIMNNDPGHDSNTFEDYLWIEDQLPFTRAFSPLRVPRTQWGLIVYIDENGMPIDPPHCFEPSQMPQGEDQYAFGLMYLLTSGRYRQPVPRPRPQGARHPRRFPVDIVFDEAFAQAADIVAAHQLLRGPTRTSGRSGASSSSKKRKADSDEPASPRGPQVAEPAEPSSQASSSSSQMPILPIVYPFNGLILVQDGEPILTMGCTPRDRVHSSADSATTEPIEDDE